MPLTDLKLGLSDHTGARRAAGIFRHFASEACDLERGAPETDRWQRCQQVCTCLPQYLLPASTCSYVRMYFVRLRRNLIKRGGGFDHVSGMTSRTKWPTCRISCSSKMIRWLPNTKCLVYRGDTFIAERLKEGISSFIAIG